MKANKALDSKATSFGDVGCTVGCGLRVLCRLEPFADYVDRKGQTEMRISGLQQISEFCHQLFPPLPLCEFHTIYTVNDLQYRVTMFLVEKCC